jgi:N6-adenosine-specific RNA methylase IME4
MYSPTDTRGQLKLGIMATLLPSLPSLPVGEYSIIAIDPPWQFNLRETDETHRGRTPYPNLTDNDIVKMQVGAIASTNAYLFLWVTNQHLPLGFKCLESWGFQYKQVYTWLKTTKASTEEDPKIRIGTGHYGRNCTEHFLVATKGNPKTFMALGIRDVPNAVLAPRREHSRKPEEFYQLCDRLGNALGGTKIDLFARQQRPGWDVWGAETDKF